MPRLTKKELLDKNNKLEKDVAFLIKDNEKLFKNCDYYKNLIENFNERIKERETTIQKQRELLQTLEAQKKLGGEINLVVALQNQLKATEDARNRFMKEVEKLQKKIRNKKVNKSNSQHDLIDDLKTERMKQERTLLELKEKIEWYETQQEALLNKKLELQQKIFSENAITEQLKTRNKELENRNKELENKFKNLVSALTMHTTELTVLQNFSKESVDKLLVTIKGQKNAA